MKQILQDCECIGTAALWGELQGLAAALMGEGGGGGGDGEGGRAVPSCKAGCCSQCLLSVFARFPGQ